MQRVHQLAQARPHAVMLREKELDVQGYEELARKVKAICEQFSVILILHKNASVAEKMNHSHLHLSMPDLRSYLKGRHPLFIGASVHSVAEAVEAEALGASYVVAGHIYPTDSKKDTSPRGVSFLQQVCQAVSIPVFAIGGIDGNNVKEIMESGAQGCCSMSAAMICKNPGMWVKSFHACFNQAMHIP